MSICHLAQAQLFYFSRNALLSFHYVVETVQNHVQTPLRSPGFFPLANGVYFVVIIKKTSLHNGNCPITDPITKMGVAHAFESCNCQYVSNEMLSIHSQKQMLSFWLQLRKFLFWIIVSW